MIAKYREAASQPSQAAALSILRQSGLHLVKVHFFPSFEVKMNKLLTLIECILGTG